MLKKIFIVFVFIIFFILLIITYKFCFLRINISNDYFIQQKPFTSNYIFYSRKHGKIIENIYEWKDEESYIYGSCFKDKDFYFLYHKKNNELILFYDLHSFYNKLDSLNLIYKMDNCKRVLDYKKIH